MTDVSYVPGPLTAVTGDHCWALVEASPDSPVVTRIWQRLGSAQAAEALLAGLLADGLGGVPGMALLTAGADGQHRLFCRGGVGATIEAQARSERIDGSGLLTWRERVVAGAERIFLGEPPADTALRLPATSGVLLAGCVVIDFTNLASRETASYGAVQPKKTIVFFPDTITVPPAEMGHAPDPAQADAARAGQAAAGQTRQENRDHASAPAAPVSFPAARPGGSDGPGPAARPVPPPLAAGTAGGANGVPGDLYGDGDYDFLWGATQARTVEEAAVRGPGDGDLLPPGHFPHDGPPVAGGPWAGPVPGGPPSGAPPTAPPSAGYPDPPPPTRLWQGPAEPPPWGGVPSGGPVPDAPLQGPPVPGPPGGLIDVPQWMAGPGESAATVRRGDLPEPAARTAPPDRIGPVVPALICQHGHVNPPSGATCRRCGASLPLDPVPVPRPVLGVLRLSVGDVITLDRGVLIGRNPRPDFAGADGEERPHVVKLPSADGDVSRTHLRVTLDGWHVLVTDLNSTNGTLVTLPGREPQQLRPGQPVPIQPGTVVTLAEGVDFRYELTD